MLLFISISFGLLFVFFLFLLSDNKYTQNLKPSIRIATSISLLLILLSVFYASLPGKESIVYMKTYSLRSMLIDGTQEQNRLILGLHFNPDGTEVILANTEERGRGFKRIEIPVKNTIKILEKNFNSTGFYTKRFCKKSSLIPGIYSAAFPCKTHSSELVLPENVIITPVD